MSEQSSIIKENMKSKALVLKNQLKANQTDGQTDGWTSLRL